jgi:hypothetical protein
MHNENVASGNPVLWKGDPQHPTGIIRGSVVPGIGGTSWAIKACGHYKVGQKCYS